MARKLGTYPLSSNIEIEAGAPLDARTIVPLKADLTRAGSFSYPYVGMEVFVTEELQKYRLIGTNPELNDNWTKTDKGVVDGYYDAEHGGFYKDQGFTKPITGTSEVLYIDKSTDNVYRWNGSAFAQINPIDSQVPTIDMADERANIAQNDDVATIMGKIAKYFDDLGEVAFSDDYDDLDNTPTKLSEFENDPGYITDEGIVTSVKVGNTSYDPVDGVVSLPQYPDISGKADKATTLAGYGITDAKIANGTITLGANTITPLTQHQDISGKADKATTLAGYGITDAKIASGTITLGSNTITPLTSHQTVTDNNPTLSWGTKSKVATIGSTAINVTMPSNPNTDTKVTSVGNHYAPAEDSTAQLDADASSSTAATWNSTSLVTGVTVKRDAKGHVTGLAVDSIKMPANPNTNTTYTFAGGTNKFTVTPSGGTAQDITITPSITNNITGSGTSGYLAKFRGANTITSGPQLGSSTTTYLRNDGSWATPPDNNTTYTIATGDGDGQIKVTPSSGSAYNVSVKGIPTKTSQLTNDSGYITSSGSCASATKATQDGDGNTISSTYMKKGVDYVTAGWKANTVLGSRVTIEGYNNTAAASYAHAEGYTTTANGYASHAEGRNTSVTAYSAHAEGYYSEATGKYSHAEGNTSAASSDNSHAEGEHTIASGIGSHSEGGPYQPFSYLDPTYTTASGQYSHAEGQGTRAVSTGSHSEGINTEAFYSAAHAEGEATHANAPSAHSEGGSTTASGNQSHAEGYGTEAKGYQSHAEGYYTIAGSDRQHVEGQYNVEDTNDLYAHIIGGGTETTRKNIFTVDWNGDVCAGRSNGLTNSTKLATGADVLGYGYIRIGVLTTGVAYSSGRYVDINVSRLTGKSILGILNVNAYGSRDNANYGIVSANSSSYTISISIYLALSGGSVPTSIGAHNVQIWYYY